MTDQTSTTSEKLAGELPAPELAPVPAPVVQDSVGHLLRTAREKKLMTVQDIANRFKLRAAQVEAVEADAWEKLPGKTFARGLVRSYARALGLDAEALALRVLEETDQEVKAIVPASTISTRPVADSPRKLRSRRDVMFMLVGVTVLVVSVLVYFLWPEESAHNEVAVMPPPVVEAPVNPVVPAPVEPATPSNLAVVSPTTAVTPVVPVQPAVQAVPPTPAGQQVVPLSPVVVPLQAPVAAPISSAPSAAESALKLTFTAKSWVEVKDKSGNVVLSVTGMPGMVKEVSGVTPFTLHIGNAGGVKLQFKGKPVDLQPNTVNNVARLKLD